MASKTIVALGAALGFLTVALGAFGAHALEERLDPEQLETWQTAVLYQGLHALALVALGTWSHVTGRSGTVAGGALGLGCLLFSGSLYAHVLGGPHGLVFVTPIGGVAFLVGWLAWGIGALRTPAGSGPDGPSAA